MRELKTKILKVFNPDTGEYEYIDALQGTPGKTPVRGTDYWTPADQEQIVQDVIAALGTPVFGTIDENKHITLSGHLATGTYTLSFEDTDGFTTDVCTIEKGVASPEEIPITWSRKTTIDSSTGVQGAQNASYDSMSVSQAISMESGFTYNIFVTTDFYCKINTYWYKADGTYISRTEPIPWSTDYNSRKTDVSVDLVPPSGAASFKLRMNYATVDTVDDHVEQLDYLTLTKIPS